MKALRYLIMLGGLTATMLAALAVTASAAPARHMPPPPDNPPAVYPAGLPAVYHVGGMPGWEITLIAVGAALTAAILAVVADRVWSARRRPATVMRSRGTAQSAVGR